MNHQLTSCPRLKSSVSLHGITRMVTKAAWGVERSKESNSYLVPGETPASGWSQTYFCTAIWLLLILFLPLVFWPLTVKQGIPTCHKDTLSKHNSTLSSKTSKFRHHKQLLSLSQKVMALSLYTLETDRVVSSVYSRQKCLQKPGYYWNFNIHVDSSFSY